MPEDYLSGRSSSSQQGGRIEYEICRYGIVQLWLMLETVNCLTSSIFYIKKASASIRHPRNGVQEKGYPLPPFSTPVPGA